MARPAFALDQAKTEETFDAIHGNMLRHFRELAEELGGCPDRALAKADIDPTGLPRASYRQFVSLLELAALDLGCADFGMQLAESCRPSGRFGGKVLRNGRVTYTVALQQNIPAMPDALAGLGLE